jgi:hypothetical protein
VVTSALECHWGNQDYHFTLVSCTCHRSGRVPLAILISYFSISITGLVVLGGHTRVKNPHVNFKNSFEGTASNGYGLSNALVKINFAYAGYNNAFNVVAEVKVCRLFMHVSQNDERG